MHRKYRSTWERVAVIITLPFTILFAEFVWRWFMPRWVRTGTRAGFAYKWEGR